MSSKQSVVEEEISDQEEKVKEMISQSRKILKIFRKYLKIYGTQNGVQRIPQKIKIKIKTNLKIIVIQKHQSKAQKIFSIKITDENPKCKDISLRVKEAYRKPDQKTHQHPIIWEEGSNKNPPILCDRSSREPQDTEGIST